MPLDLAQSQQLLVRIVEEGFAQRHSPLPGAYVKAQLLSRAVDQGEAFSERALGFKGFPEFVKTVKQVAIQGAFRQRCSIGADNGKRRSFRLRRTTPATPKGFLARIH